jgi:hypothetical protein
MSFLNDWGTSLDTKRLKENHVEAVKISWIRGFALEN